MGRTQGSTAASLVNGVARSKEGGLGGGSLDCGLTSVETALGSGVSTTSSGRRHDLLLDGEGGLCSCQACPVVP
jgi:hypothetical protein